MVDTEWIHFGITGILSAGIAFGVLKSSSLTKDEHKNICDSERKKTEEHLNRLYDTQGKTFGMVKEIHGYLKAKNGGNL